MGKAHFERGRIPVSGEPEDELIEQRIAIGDEAFLVSAASVGNPHAVIFCGDVQGVPIERLGPAIENHASFPARANVHFVEVMSANKIRIRVWERGVGPTLSCGTGASASVAIAARLGKVSPPVHVFMPGGTLIIDIEKDGEIIMRGEARPVFKGWLEYEA